MHQKVSSLKTQIEDGLPGSSVEHTFADDLHEFRINLKGGGTHWVLFGRETMDAMDAAGLCTLLETYQVVDGLKESSFSKRILLTRYGPLDCATPKT